MAMVAVTAPLTRNPFGANMTRVPAGCALLFKAAILAGCARQGQGEDPWLPAPTHKGSGGVIAYWVRHADGLQPVVVRKDHAMVLVGASDCVHDRPVFYLYDNRDKRYLATKALDSFLDELGRIPREAGFEWIERCGCGFSVGIRREEYGEIVEVFRDRGYRNLAAYIRLSCRCGSTGFRFPGAGPSDGSGAAKPSEGEGRETE